MISPPSRVSFWNLRPLRRTAVAHLNCRRAITHGESPHQPVIQLGSSRSLRRAYVDWVEEQVEAYKDSVPRSELLRLADTVVEELAVTKRGQYLLTELLLCSAVDRKIFRMLRLPGYRTWRAALNGNGNGAHPPPPAEQLEEDLGVFSTQDLSSQ